ncbi:MAG TPA: hypothetical protein PKL14_09475 [Holophaga sp.]|nr:hypothetical protein [Holophaga sp.]
MLESACRRILPGPFLCTPPCQKLDHPSLQHDLGFHWQWSPHTI